MKSIILATTAAVFAGGSAMFTPVVLRFQIRQFQICKDVLVQDTNNGILVVCIWHILFSLFLCPNVVWGCCSSMQIDHIEHCAHRNVGLD